MPFCPDINRSFDCCVAAMALVPLSVEVDARERIHTTALSPAY
jgi:hypothetical protein